MSEFDAILVVSFGGPDGPDDVIPFLENVLRGRNVPRERMLEVAEHYHHFGGTSPINAQNRALIAALVNELNTHGPQLPVYWGNRNWHPQLAGTLAEMADDGIQHALAFFTSPYSSYSGCRQYRENIEAARAEVGSSAPLVSKLRAYFNHPGFVEPMIDRVTSAYEELDESQRERAPLIFTAHSIPGAMAATCEYENQLREACRLVADGAGKSGWQVVFQSRSGPPAQPWLEPDICDVLREIGQQNAAKDVVVAPIGFISDHMEVVYDLDYEAAEVCRKGGINMIRAATVGTHPRFVGMIRELIVERVDESTQRSALGDLGSSHDECPVDCCRYEPSRARGTRE